MKLLAVTASFGAALLFTMTVANASGGEAIFKKKCASCHYTDGPAREKTIADQLAKKGPELWYAGSKFQKDWLAGWLQKPEPIRPLKYNSLTDKNKGDHPQSSASDAAALTEYLMGLKSPEVKAAGIAPRASTQAKQIFNKKMPCTGCHTYPAGSYVIGGLSGPTLAGAAKRLNPDWIFAYLLNIKHFKPVRAMPDFASALGQKELESLAAYVATFE